MYRSQALLRSIDLHDKHARRHRNNDSLADVFSSIRPTETFFEDYEAIVSGHSGLREAE